MEWKKMGKKEVLTENNAVHKCQTALRAWSETMFAGLTSLCNPIFISLEFDDVSPLLLQL